MMKIHYICLCMKLLKNNIFLLKNIKNKPADHRVDSVVGMQD